jgi:hypothetical protein
MDGAINSMISGDKAAQGLRFRARQSAERNEVQTKIDAANEEKMKISQELVPLRLQVNEVETKLGPIKYVADLFGQKDTEVAVRIVILILMFAFDPLAIALVISGTISLSEALASRGRPTKPDFLSEGVEPDDVNLPKYGPIKIGPIRHGRLRKKNLEAAAFYCPYVPQLEVSNDVAKGFMTRYGHVGSEKPVDEFITSHTHFPHFNVDVPMPKRKQPRAYPLADPYPREDQPTKAYVDALAADHPMIIHRDPVTKEEITREEYETRSIKVEDLSDEDIALIAASEMAPEHDILDDLLEEQPTEEVDLFDDLGGPPEGEADFTVGETPDEHNNLLIELEEDLIKAQQTATDDRNTLLTILERRPEFVMELIEVINGSRDEANAATTTEGSWMDDEWSPPPAK